MPNRSGFSEKNLTLAEISYYYQDTKQALKSYFNGLAVSADPQFVGYSPNDVLEIRLDELDYSSSLTILASLEAAFRVDYLTRVSLKLKDRVSREFRALYKKKEHRVSLEDEILNIWRDFSIVDSKVIEELKGAFKYRHWLAHGRYWVPKLPRKYDYFYVYDVADEVFAKFDLRQ